MILDYLKIFSILWPSVTLEETRNLESGGLLWPHLHDLHACHGPLNVFLCLCPHQYINQGRYSLPLRGFFFFSFSLENGKQSLIRIYIIFNFWDIQKQTEEYSESLHIYHIALTIINGQTCCNSTYFHTSHIISKQIPNVWFHYKIFQHVTLENFKSYNQNISI